MTVHLNSQADLEAAIKTLVKQDKRLKPILQVAGMPALRRRQPGFAGLAAIVCGQQFSTQSAAAIWGRVAAAFEPFHHDAIRRARADRLGRLGLSIAKIKTLKNLARELAAERLNLELLGGNGRRRRPRRADRAARHRPVDRGHLSAVLPGPWRRLAGRRPRGAGSDAARARTSTRARPPSRWRPWPNPGARCAAPPRICGGAIITR